MTLEKSCELKDQRTAPAFALCPFSIKMSCCAIFSQCGTGKCVSLESLWLKACDQFQVFDCYDTGLSKRNFKKVKVLQSTPDIVSIYKRAAT